MKLSPKAQNIYSTISKSTKMGELKATAKNIKVDHELAIELWSTGEFMPRLLATLIMAAKVLTQDVIDQLDKDMLQHDDEEKLQLMDWLMANQLMKNKKTLL